MFSRLVVLMFLAILRFVLGNNLYIKQSMYGIFTHKFTKKIQPNAGRYTYHTWMVWEYDTVFSCWPCKNGRTNRGREDVSSCRDALLGAILSITRWGTDELSWI